MLEEDSCVDGPEVMLSGEVDYFKGTMQLTHPAFLVLDFAHRQGDRHQVAQDNRLGVGERPATTCSRSSRRTSSRSTRPIPRCRPGRSTPACARSSPYWIPIAETLPKSFVREHNLMSEDQALRAIHVAENDSRTKSRHRATHLRRGGGIAVGPGGAQAQRVERLGPAGATPRRRAGGRDDGPVAVRADRTDSAMSSR